MPLNVLYVTNNAGRASTTIATKGWIEHLHVRGLRATIVSPIVGEFAEWARVQHGVASYRVDLPPPSKTKLVPFLRAMWKLRRIVGRHQIDLIHSNEQGVYPIAQYLARLCRLPIVVGVHSMMERGFASWAFGGRRGPDRLFFLTAASREVCRPAVQGVVPEAVWRILPNGLDVDSIRPDPQAGLDFRRKYYLGSGPLIGAATWLRPGKQVEHLVHVAQALKQEATLVVAGGVAPGEEEYAKALLEDATTQLGPRLRYLGYLEDPRGLYNALDLYVNTSLAETCSISIIESLACGLPVVGYPSVSVEEQVMPGGGEIVPQDDWRRLADVVDSWLRNQDRRRHAQLEARRRAESAFDIRKLSLQLWREYEALLNEKAGGMPERASANG